VGNNSVRVHFTILCYWKIPGGSAAKKTDANGGKRERKGCILLCICHINFCTLQMHKLYKIIRASAANVI